MTVFAIYAFYFVFPKLLIPDDAASTVTNIKSNELLFRFGIGSCIIVIICDILVAWGLYIFLRPINKMLSLLVAWMRLIYSVIFAVALVNYFQVIPYIEPVNYLYVLEPEQIQTQIMLAVKAFDQEWSMGSIFFGLHLILLGYLITKAHYMPKWLGLLIIVTGFSYLIDNFCYFLLLNYDLGLSIYIGWGELILVVWLLVKGTKINDPKM